MRHMNAPYERSAPQTGNLRNGSSNVSPRSPVPSKSRNWQNFLHSISTPDRFRNFARIGAWKIR